MNNLKNIFGNILNRIKSKTTGRMYSGKTFYEENQKSPFIQRIDLSNSWRDDYVVEIEFSEQEFNTTHKFCRGISRIVISELRFSFND